MGRQDKSSGISFVFLMSSEKKAGEREGNWRMSLLGKAAG